MKTIEGHFSLQSHSIRPHKISSHQSLHARRINPALDLRESGKELVGKGSGTVFNKKRCGYIFKITPCMFELLDSKIEKTPTCFDFGIFDPNPQLDIKF